MFRTSDLVCMSCGTDETFPRERSGYVGQAVKGDVEQDPYAFVEVESLPGMSGEDPAGSGGGVKGPGRRGCGLGLCDPIGGLLGKKSYRRQASLDVRPGDDVVRIEAVVAGSSLRRPGSVRRVDRSRDR